MQFALPSMAWNGGTYAGGPSRNVAPARGAQCNRMGCDTESRLDERPFELLAFVETMDEFLHRGSLMIQDPEYSRRLAQNLVELLSPYEEELIQLERDAPAFGPLRRAIGIVIAEACYCISDRPFPLESLASSADEEANRTDDEANRAR